MLKIGEFHPAETYRGVGLRSPGSVHVEMGELRGWDGRLMAGGYKKPAKPLVNIEKNTKKRWNIMKISILWLGKSTISMGHFQ